MDLANLGLNVGVLVGIVGASEYLKSFQLKEKMGKWYIMVPIILSAIASLVITKPLIVQDFLKNLFIYFGVSTLAYQSILKKVKQ